MKKILTAALLCMALAVTMVPGAFAADTGSNYTQCMAAIQEQKTIQSQAHQTAESPPSAGLWREQFLHQGRPGGVVGCPGRDRRLPEARQVHR